MERRNVFNIVPPIIRRPNNDLLRFLFALGQQAGSGEVQSVVCLYLNELQSSMAQFTVGLEDNYDKLAFTGALEAIKINIMEEFR